MGFSIIELGGGMQTKSLRLQDRAGKGWVLRTVEKNIKPNLPSLLQSTFAEDVVQDMISAAHPYAPLTIPPLAKTIGLAVPDPVLYYVPSDPDLEPYKNIFANSLCFLEEREPTPDNSETKSTVEVLEKLIKTNDNLVAQEEVLKARLLDMLLADWDRHADQWRWGSSDSAGQKYYYAIPRDRDQAYFYSNGVLLKIARYMAARHFVGFRERLAKLTNLNFKAWKFDRTFLNSLDDQQWHRIITETKNLWTDALIDKAVLKLPSAVYGINGGVIGAKLKQRRDDLLKAGMKYYAFLANSVTINGTDGEEIFKLSNAGNLLHIDVYAQKDGKLGDRLYRRSFTQKVTEEIALIGLGGNDTFIIEKGTVSKIRVKIWGGAGADTYSMQGAVKNLIYESSQEENKFEHTLRSKLKQIR
jgi:hypothetical protein